MRLKRMSLRDLEHCCEDDMELEIYSGLGEEEGEGEGEGKRKEAAMVCVYICVCTLNVYGEEGMSQSLVPWILFHVANGVTT